MSQGKINVVFAVNDFLVGGMQRQFTEQIRYFDRTRYDLTLVSLFEFPGAATLYDELPADLPVHRLRFEGFRDVRSWIRLYGVLRSLRPDVVVSNLFFCNTVVRVLKPLVGYAVIICEHNTYLDKTHAQQAVDRVLARVTHRIIAVSSTVATFTARQERIAAEKFEVIHNGVDTQALQRKLDALAPVPDLKRERGFDPEDHVLVNVARLIGQKNHELLIKGFAAFHALHPNYRLALVGEGPLGDELMALVRTLGLEEAVHFFGLRRDVEAFYRIADAFVSASRIEGLSIAYLEALASGVPLVSTSTAGTDEMIREGENGIFIRSATPEAVTAALELFMRSDREALSRGAAETAGHFDIRTTVEGYERLISAADNA